MLITTTDTIQGKNIATVLGLVRGNTVRTRNIGNDIIAGLKNIVGGEVSQYTQLQADAREQALQRMQQDAERMGADAVVGVRIVVASVMQGATELLAYGTAVKLQ